MQVKEIASSSNPLLKTVRSLRDRSGQKEERAVSIQGVKLLEGALNNDLDVQDIIVGSAFLKNGMPGMPRGGWRRACKLSGNSLFTSGAFASTVRLR